MNGYSAEGRSQCEPCSPNSNAVTGSGVIEDCKCSPGYSGLDGGPCHFCISGKFKTLNGGVHELCGKHVLYRHHTNIQEDLYCVQSQRTVAGGQ